MKKKKSRQTRRKVGLAAHQKKINMEALFDKKSYGCMLCGYDDCVEAVHLHHVKEKDPELRSIKDAARYWEPKRFQAELKKCVPLCATCHSEYHNDFETKWKESQFREYFLY